MGSEMDEMVGPDAQYLMHIYTNFWLLEGPGNGVTRQKKSSEWYSQIYLEFQIESHQVCTEQKGSATRPPGPKYPTPPEQS